MKKLAVLLLILLTGCTHGMRDFGMDLESAYKTAGFKFPLALSNYKVRAKRGVIAVTYPLDEFRTVTVEKSMTEFPVRNNYPVNGDLTLKNGVIIYANGDGNKVYVMNMAASGGYYRATCKKA